jgi:Xaa-Pro aminopeptidase
MIKMQGFNDEELQNFHRYQRLSYQILEDTALGLKVGDSEEATARKMRKAFHKAGAHNYFHVPVALFGERSAYPGDFGPFEALATARILQEQDTVILDAAPIFDGYTVDTSHAFNFANSEAFDRIDRELPILRDLIARSVNDGEMFQQIAWDVDDYIRKRGFENCHRKHIGAVLGHLVTKATSQRLASWSYKGLAVKQVSWFLARSRFSGTTPNWNHTNACKGVAPHGLWAVEPHLAEGSVGAKFEEILIIDEDGARWLDDDLPHHRRWADLKPSG